VGSKALLEYNNVKIFSVPPVVLLLLKEAIKRVLLCRRRPLLYFCCRCIPEGKIITKVTSIFLNDPFRLRFAALIVGCGIIKAAVQAAVKVRITERARLNSASLLASVKFSFAGKANFHDCSP
jgi:hypothetical protein